MDSSLNRFNFIRRQRWGLTDLLIVLALVVGVYLVYRVSFGAVQNPYTCAEPHPALRIGDKGPCVQHLQWYLGKLKTPTQIDVYENGDFDLFTRQALAQFQQREGLLISGKTDEAVWSAIHPKFGIQAVQGSRADAPTGSKFNLLLLAFASAFGLIAWRAIARRRRLRAAAEDSDSDEQPWPQPTNVKSSEYGPGQVFNPKKPPAGNGKKRRK